MSIKVIDTIEPKTQEFKVVDSSNVGYKGNSLEQHLDSFVQIIQKTVDEYLRSNPDASRDMVEKIVTDYILANKDSLKGDKGDMICGFEVDDLGNLYLLCQDGTTPPNLEYDEVTGNLYLVLE